MSSRSMLCFFSQGLEWQIWATDSWARFKIERKDSCPWIWRRRVNHWWWCPVLLQFWVSLASPTHSLSNAILPNSPDVSKTFTPKVLSCSVRQPTLLQPLIKRNVQNWRLSQECKFFPAFQVYTEAISFLLTPTVSLLPADLRDWVMCRDQRLYKQVLTPSVQEPKALTPADSKLRFADGIIDEARKSIITVQEDHSGSGEAVNTIATVGTDLPAINLHESSLRRCSPLKFSIFSLWLNILAMPRSLTKTLDSEYSSSFQEYILKESSNLVWLAHHGCRSRDRQEHSDCQREWLLLKSCAFTGWIQTRLDRMVAPKYVSSPLQSGQCLCKCHYAIPSETAYLKLPD